MAVVAPVSSAANMCLSGGKPILVKSPLLTGIRTGSLDDSDLTELNRDGSGEGYDIDLIKNVFNSINIPLIPCGGVGNFEHFKDLLQEVELTAISAGNIFNFTERSYEKAKNYLKNKGLNFR